MQLQSLELKGNNFYPSILLDRVSNSYRISGRSVMEDADVFYRSVISWFDQFSLFPSPELNLVIDLTCFNIATSKKILFLLYKLEEIDKNSLSKVSITWCHNIDDDDMAEVGQDFAVMVKIPFIFSVYHRQEVLLTA